MSSEYASPASLGMTKRLFARLDIWHDNVPRSAAMNMAIDEALLESVPAPTIRFYRWDHPALSFGYFGKFADVAGHASGRDLVRRWTGGGIVFHGEDLTYSIVIPSSDPLFGESPMSIYENVHRALRDAFVAEGNHAELWSSVAQDGRGKFRDACAPQTCFANPVRADVMMNDRKIAGAAQRRTRRGLVQQGSIQSVAVENGLPERFAEALSSETETRERGRELLERARNIANQKYGTEDWLRKR